MNKDEDKPSIKSNEANEDKSLERSDEKIPSQEEIEKKVDLAYILKVLQEAVY